MTDPTVDHDPFTCKECSPTIWVQMELRGRLWRVTGRPAAVIQGALVAFAAVGLGTVLAMVATAIVLVVTQ